jgi:DNA polymerase (family 10)
MTNEEIIEALDITGKLMELHNENPFKSKAYLSASYKLGKLRYNFNGKSPEELSAIEGVGKTISKAVGELMHNGTTKELADLLERTPSGVIQMLSIKGLGPKKVRQLWLELNVESIGELLYACNENRLVALKGFGEKTQAQVKQNIEFKLSVQQKFHYATLATIVVELSEQIRKNQPDCKVAIVGQLARKCEVIDKIEILLTTPLVTDVSAVEAFIPLPVNYTYCAAEEFEYKCVELSSTAEHLNKIGFTTLAPGNFKDQQEVYSRLQLQYIEPELREGLLEAELARSNKIPKLIEYGDLRGILHNHTTYSDGIHTLKEMADHCRSMGFSYFGVCDHSKTAAYAGGLSIEKVLEQQQEIEKLNSTYPNFRILKGIESDILGDGTLDYPEEILRTFDLVVASVHSNLKMSEEKATARLLKAIENPYTHILGHPSGRLLLARNGYPLDYKKIIDACAANKVIIELNAHPYRLDIDWRWIPYCIEKGVMISINPDAHHKDGLADMYYGVCAARKGMLDKASCFNALELPELLKRLKK